MAYAERRLEPETGRVAIDSPVAANLEVLRQGLDLLARISDEDYTRTVDPLFGFGVGSHIRHCLDSYRCFIRGLATGLIDFDSRDRDMRVALDREYARGQIDWTIIELKRIASSTVPASIQSRQDSPCWAQSSVVRELQFLLSHTVHHFALIALMLRIQGIEISADFGVAPSTLEYWKTS